MRRAILLVLVVSILLLASGVVAQPEGSELPPACLVEQGTVSGGGYRLTGLSWRIDGSVRAGAYQLFTQSVTSLQSGGCCCTYLPITLRSTP